MPSEFIRPADAQLVLSAIRHARHTGVDIVDELHNRDLVLTEARRKELVNDEFGIFVRDLERISPEGILRWYFRDSNPRTPKEMFEATRAWILWYMEQRTKPS
jgi:hypothetical protein